MTNDYFHGKINTGLYGADAWQFIQNFIFTIDSRSIFGRACTSAQYMNAYLDSTNEVIIDVRKPTGYFDRQHRSSIFRKATDAKGVLKELAYMIKKYMYHTFTSEWLNSDVKMSSKNYNRTRWTHRNKNLVEKLCGPSHETYEYKHLFKMDSYKGHVKPNTEFTITVAEVNYIYTMFRDYSRNHTSKFAKAIVKRFTSDKFDPLQTEMEACRRQEYQRIYDEFQTKIDDAIPEWSYKSNVQSAAYLELQSIINEFKAKQEEVVADLKSQRDAALKELSESLSFLTNV